MHGTLAAQPGDLMMKAYAAECNSPVSVSIESDEEAAQPAFSFDGELGGAEKLSQPGGAGGRVRVPDAAAQARRAPEGRSGLVAAPRLRRAGLCRGARALAAGWVVRLTSCAFFAAVRGSRVPSDPPPTRPLAETTIIFDWDGAWRGAAAGGGFGAAVGPPVPLRVCGGGAISRTRAPLTHSRAP